MFLSIFPLQACSFFILFLCVGKDNTHSIFDAFINVIFHGKFDGFNPDHGLLVERVLACAINFLVRFEILKFDFTHAGDVRVVQLLPGAALKVHCLLLFLHVGSANSIVRFDSRHRVLFFDLYWRRALFNFFNHLFLCTALLPEDEKDYKGDESHDSEGDDHHSGRVTGARLRGSRYVTHFLSVGRDGGIRIDCTLSKLIISETLLLNRLFKLFLSFHKVSEVKRVNFRFSGVELVSVETVEDKEGCLFGRVQFQLMVCTRVQVTPASRPAHSVFLNFGVFSHVPALSVNFRVHRYSRNPLFLHEFQALLEVDCRTLVKIRQFAGQCPTFILIIGGFWLLLEGVLARLNRV